MYQPCSCILLHKKCGQPRVLPKILESMALALLISYQERHMACKTTARAVLVLIKDS